MTNSVLSSFDLTDRVAIITGGAGLLGRKHAEAVAELGGIPCLLDLDAIRAADAAKDLEATHGCQTFSIGVDITNPDAITAVRDAILTRFGRIDILINNAANNPKMESTDGANWSRFEDFPLQIWQDDISVGLTGAMLCAKIFGTHMAQKDGGVILNIASDLGVIAPDQRIYRNEGESTETQSVKPVTYSVVKAGLIGLTRYLATYWPDKGVRANVLAPGGVYNGQDDAFVERLTNLIPMGRMADKDEYKAAVAFMISDASSYMNGTTLSIDGGRTVW
ncbi:SDR family oxidoreductase [Cohaesibacter sp. CAU 1516]|uniref:SDR family oxidoreductase n=1 Tax=Cohaesibacter sp. CAU 1516 TaxID=2576038 RepID=UPI0010FF310C|nr:SDR family oxidoreductase [Cohaesibacter sp. CAU 1516]TLP48512.1 SDR family oxidoreductase [Cohaesibacter sp. CAU 1516]